MAGGQGFTAQGPLPSRKQGSSPHLRWCLCKAGWGLHLRPGNQGEPVPLATLEGGAQMPAGDRPVWSPGWGRPSLLAGLAGEGAR